MWNPNAVDNRQLEKRVVVGRVRPTWARNLPEAREDEDKNEEIGVMLLGDSGVGKTCMLVRFRDGTFLAGNYISTVGIDFRVPRQNP
ncbi:hypothetical protein MSG28_003549 [Choristoneura fumiferana]|uniref:Uncharacterized protein n=1 Tax=Choristoneura fumiferana TaxID=7141 RepID=A0ACC0KFF8_CHOFU|nr:hypothetical protein MSG28_003549 [Choristoneura fumiferana]